MVLVIIDCGQIRFRAVNSPLSLPWLLDVTIPGAIIAPGP